MITPMIILCLLAGPLLVAFFHSKFYNRQLNVAKYACWGLGITFIYFFMGHVFKAEGMTQMLPPWVPFRLQLVYMTGLIELLVAGALFIGRYQQRAAYIAIVIFVVFFPANIYSALNSVGLGGHQWGAAYLLIRGPLQMILIAWAYFLCIKK